MLDGEIFIAIDGRLDFDALSQRIHPAASRVATLAERTPASFVAFDLLALDGESSSTSRSPYAGPRLEEALAGADPIHVTRTTTDAAEAEEWFGIFEGAGLDGVVAKALAKP